MKVVSLLGLVHKVRTCGRPEARTRSPKRIVLPMEQYAPGRPARKSGDQPYSPLLQSVGAKEEGSRSRRCRAAQIPPHTSQPALSEMIRSHSSLLGYSRLKICATGVGEPEN